MDTSKIEIIDPNGDVILTLLKDSDGKPDHDAAANAVGAPNQHRLKVSFKHLILSSPYFTNRLGPNWPEGQELALNGIVGMKIDGFEYEALHIVLNIMHPRKTKSQKGWPPICWPRLL